MHSWRWTLGIWGHYGANEMRSTSLTAASARRRFVGAVILALLGTVGTAGAASIDLGTVNADPTTGSGGTFTFLGNDYQYFNVLINVDPFTINSGDDVTVTVHMTPSALTIPSGNQFVGLNFEPRDGDFGGGPLTGIHTIGTMEFSNGSGGPNGVGPTGPGDFNAFSNVWGGSGALWTLVDVMSIATYTWDGGEPLTFSQISVSYQIDNPTATPLPAALPLFATGLGAFGVLGWRRKRRAAALAA